MYAILDFFLDYVGFIFMMFGYFMFIRTTSIIVTSLNKGTRRMLDIDVDEWIDMVAAVTAVLVGFWLTQF
jgi:vacuolar-type H+-ATPase subunit I/STV1